MSVAFAGGVKFRAERRGHAVVCDQRQKGGGEDSAMEPFELFISSLVMCMGHFALVYARKNGWSPEGMTLDAAFTTARDPFRLATVDVKIRLPNADPGTRREALARAALACPVHRSLAEGVKVTASVAD